MSWWDSLGSIASGVGDFYDSNKSWINPVVEAGVGAFQQSNKDDAQGQYLDYLRQKEKQNYEASVAQINAYNASLGQGGGGGGGNGAAAAAARATEANRQRAAKKSNKSLQKTYKDLLGMYGPYRETADRLLPQMTQTYENSLGMQKGFMDYLQNPNQMKKLDASVPAWNVNIPLPDSVRLK